MKKETTTLKGIWTFTLENINTGKKRIFKYYNLIPTAGRQQIAKGLSGGFATTAEGEINYTSLGTGTTAPANGDTTLETETYGQAVASLTYASNKLYATAFYTAVEVAGTFNEAGLHINGTASPDTGILFSRVAIDITKTASETLTIAYEVTIT